MVQFQWDKIPFSRAKADFSAKDRLEPGLATVMLYSELWQKKCLQSQPQIPQSESILMGVLERCSNYFKAVNSLARIIGWNDRAAKISLLL